MEIVELIKCPICNNDKTEELLNLDCGNLDNSLLYRYISIQACRNCGHIYNKLSSNDIYELAKYYNEEYAPINLGAKDKTGDRPGSNNQHTVERHDQLYNLIAPYITNNASILDVGCAVGGFLDYLRNRGMANLSGIDLTDKYVNFAKQKGLYNIKLGCAENIPFNDNFFDLLVIDQVLEHSINPLKVFKEAKRVLKDNGLLCIGIPDAARYEEKRFFDFFWFIMREHIQHFDIDHIKLLALQEGFEIVAFNSSEIPMMSEKMILPNLNVICRKTNNILETEITQDSFNLADKMVKYIAVENAMLEKRKQIIKNFKKSGKPVYSWGVGREFLYLYESAGLKECNIAGLIDMNPYKQKNFTVDGIKIHDKQILDSNNESSVLIISAFAHSSSIKADLLKMGYSGEICEL